MKLYLLTYDNGEQYEGNDHYTIAVFDDFEKACQFCLHKGFEKTETEGFFKKEPPGGVRLIWDYESIAVEEIEMNKEITFD